jgi:glycosyltransferase involved in cell wall biosynthesis
MGSSPVPDRRIRLLLFNLATDSRDPILGFTTSWTNALAKRAEFVDVVTMRSGRIEVANNVRVYSVGKELGRSEPQRALSFYRILRRLLRARTYDACFAHMMPIFAAMAYPLLKRRRIPLTLWYTHEAGRSLLRVAERVVDRIITASPESFPFPSSKLIVTGHGIDTAVFAPTQGAASTRTSPVIVSVGRVGPIKRIEVLIEAVRVLTQENVDVTLRIVGPIAERDQGYGLNLIRQVEAAGLSEVVSWLGPVPPGEVVEEYQRACLALNMRLTGAMDKAVLEAMACGIPVLTTNRTFARLFGELAEYLIPPEDDPHLIAAACRRLLGMAEWERTELGMRLRELVKREHSLDRLAERLTGSLLWATLR